MIPLIASQGFVPERLPIISETCEETIEDFGQSPAIDAGLVAAGQAVGALRDGALRGSDRLGEAIE